MKKLILTMFVGAFGAIAVQAQEIPERKHDKFKPHENHRGNHDKKQMADLDLTEDQKSKFKALNLEHRKQMDELRKQENITVKESKERMESIRKDHESKFQAILTSEQKAKLEKNKADRNNRMKEYGKKKGEKMKTSLGLTDDQAAKMKESREEMGTKMKAVRENTNLKPEEKEAKMKELKNEHKEKMKSILTKEQLQKMKEGKKHDGMRKKKENKQTI